MNKKNNNCSYCSVKPIRYVCLQCRGNGTTHTPKDIYRFGDGVDDFVALTLENNKCSKCNGDGFVLVPPIIANQHPENIMNNFIF
jgi:nitrate reductase cytochrome c-type subunit